MQKSVKIGRAPQERDEVERMLARADHTKIKYLSPAEVRRFLATIPRGHLRDRLLFDLVYHYGLRRSEVCLLRLDDVDLTTGTIYIRRLKGGISKYYPLFPSTRKLLRTYVDTPKRYWTWNLFPSRQRLGDAISASLVAFLFRGYAVTADLPADKRHVHVLRHSIAMHMTEAGIGVLDVADWLGHASVTSTEVYAHISPHRRSGNLERMLKTREIA